MRWDAQSPDLWIVAAVAALILGAISTRLAIVYAERARMIDAPGARRSHRRPTPRGGGIGIVVAVLVCACLPPIVLAPALRFAAACLASAIVLVATVGWIDDRKGLSARVRIAAHVAAAFLFLLPVLLPLVLIPNVIERAFEISAPAAWALAVLAAFAIVGSINLHNFMDGIDGLLAAQAIFVFAALAILIAHAGATAHAGQIGVFAAAALAFAPFNAPRARVFMGDVGSGVVGLLVAVATIWQMGTPGTALASGLVLSSAFVVDAGATLVSRMLRGKRWYHAHREHLYQWLARRLGSHSRVVAIYATWNLLVAAPAVWWINRRPAPIMPTSPSTSPDRIVSTEALLAAAVYVVGFAAWVIGKRACLARPARRATDASA